MEWKATVLVSPLQGIKDDSDDDEIAHSAEVVTITGRASN
jgi:hypothetical protein